MTKLHKQLTGCILGAILIATCTTACTPEFSSTSMATPTSVAISLPTPSATLTPQPPTVAQATVAPTIVPPPTAEPTVVPPATSTSTPPPASATPAERVNQIVGTRVRFAAGSTAVEVTIGEDNPAVRDFLSMLPLTLKLEDLAGREKISYLPRKLAYAGSPGSDPEDGDLIYFVSWGNLGFYYNAAGIDYSDLTIHLGTYAATRDQLNQLEGKEVVVEVVR